MNLFFFFSLFFFSSLFYKTTEHLNEGRVTASNVLLCPDIVTATSEVSSNFVSIGPTLGLLNPAKPLAAKFVIKPDSSGGYVGCFRDKYASGNMQSADMWFVNNFGSHSITPATCAWMCREKGFTLSSNDWHSHHCRCGDKYGSYTCDSHGHCGLPQLEDSMCRYSCTYSDRLQKCGGHYYHPRSIAIYKTTGESYVLPTDLANTPVCSDAVLPCSRVYDGRNDQAWKSTTNSYDAGGSSIVLELKELRRISALRILWSVSGDHSKAATLSISVKTTSGGSYSIVATTTKISTSNYQFIRITPTVDALFVKIEFLTKASSGTDYRLQEMWLNYYQTTLKEQETFILRSSKLLSITNSFSPNKIEGNLTMMQGGPQFFVTDYFSIIETTGQIQLNSLLLDYEAVSSYNVIVAAYSKGFDSGWFTMQAQQGINSYKELTHNQGGVPGVVYVLSKSFNGGADGNGATGYIYPGIGSVQADERYVKVLMFYFTLFTIYYYYLILY